MKGHRIQWFGHAMRRNINYIKISIERQQTENRVQRYTKETVDSRWSMAGPGKLEFTKFCEERTQDDVY